ncbi:MAG: hypothetical protein Q7N95_11565 [Alphaproteobacteria bacterium]|nr:hypothetical protein [Alphaproteobacteria bacterium]
MKPITGLDAIEMLRILGLSVRLDGAKLFVSPADLIDPDVAWLVRTHKAGIIAELLDDGPRWAWLVRMPDGSTFETYHFSDTTAAGVMMKYPAALSVMPLSECLWPHDSAKEQAA